MDENNSSKSSNPVASNPSYEQDWNHETMVKEGVSKMYRYRKMPARVEFDEAVDSYPKKYLNSTESSLKKLKKEDLIQLVLDVRITYFN